ncbi:MAG TPA: YitT family protein, partial [Mangrovimonas sp.]|nr:YitT family protein [Mangrovimonas sp.]
MRSVIQNILVNIAKKRTKSSGSAYQNQKSVLLLAQSLQVDLKHLLKESFFMVIGVFSAGFGLKGFLLPNKFIDGGATGISLLLENLTSISLGVLLVLVNIPFIVLGIKTLNLRFAIKSILAITFLAFVVHFIEYPLITQDKLLIAVFGGFFLGLGIGMAIRGGSVIDGTEVLAIFLSRKLSMTIGDV